MAQTANSKYQQLFLRLALGTALLSAVADRFGLWGAHAAWGNWENFEAYTGKVTGFLPASLTPFNAIAATVLETIFGGLLIIGFKTRLTAACTGVLLLLFALSMSISLGIKSALDYSVWVGSAGAFLLATQPQYAFSIDQLNKTKEI